MLFKQMVVAKEEAERPWQEDIDQLQRMLQEVLQAVSRLSGVELPGSTSDRKSPGNTSPQLDCKTLKERILTDLETFSDATADELAKRTERQARVALAAIHREADGQVERVARELREKLQEQLQPEHLDIGITQQTRDRVAELVERRTEEFARWTWVMCKGTGAPIPVQIQNLLEPYVEGATKEFTESFRRQFQEEIARHEQSARQRLQAVLSSLEGKVISLEQSAQDVCEQTAGSAFRMSEERLAAAAGEAAQNFEGRIRLLMENALIGFHARLEQMADASRQSLQQQEEEMTGRLGRKMEGIDSEIGEKIKGEISRHVEQLTAGVIEVATQQLRQRAEESVDQGKNEIRGFLDIQMENARVRINELDQSARLSLIQETERRDEAVRKLEEDIAGIRARYGGEFQDQLAGTVSAVLGSVREQASQASEVQLGEVEKQMREFREREASHFGEQLRSITDTWYANLVERIQSEAGKVGSRVAAEVRENSVSVLQELSDKVDTSSTVLRELEDRAAARMESLLKHSLEAYQQQLMQISEVQLGEHRRVIRNSLADLQGRLERSARILQQSFAASSEPDLPQPVGSNGSQL